MNRRNFLQGLAAFFTGARLLKPGQDVIVDPAALIIQPEAPQIAVPSALVPNTLVRLEFNDGYRVDIAPLSIEVEFTRNLLDISSLYSPKRQQLSPSWTDTEMDMLTYANPAHHQRITEALRSREEFLTRIRLPQAGNGYDIPSRLRAEAFSLPVDEPIQSRLLIVGSGKPEFIKMTGLARYKSVEGFSK